MGSTVSPIDFQVGNHAAGSASRRRLTVLYGARLVLRRDESQRYQASRTFSGERTVAHLCLNAAEYDRMTNHLIWAVGLLGDLLILAVLFARRRVPRFPWFTLLIAFHFLTSVGLKASLHLSGHAVSGSTAIIIDITDVLLQCAILAQLTWIALLPLDGIRRLTLPLLLVAGDVLIAMHFEPAAYHSLRMGLVLMHFLISVLLLEWAIVLALLLPSLGLSWRNHVAAISFGYGVFSAVQLAAGGYFGQETSDYVFSSSFRISVYLLILLWWLVTLWLAEPSVPQRKFKEEKSNLLQTAHQRP